VIHSVVCKTISTCLCSSLRLYHWLNITWTFQ